MGSSAGVESIPGEREERLFSIMLSTSELAKLDLSNLQLFQASTDFTQNRLNDHEKEADPLSQLTRQDSFSFPPEAEVGTSTASGLSIAVQVFKSKGVIEAEKSMMEQNKGNKSCPKKSAAIDQTGLDRFESLQVVETERIKKAQDKSAVHGKLRPPPLPIEINRAGEDRAELTEEIMNIKSGIDLKSSPASKFLAQHMPWELQPSPVTPFTPAAVPFKWEEVPGKPKPLHDANRLAPQTNSFPVLHPPPRLLIPPQAAMKLPAPQSQSGAQHSRFNSGSCDTEKEKRAVSVESKRVEESPGCVSSLDYKLPSPWNGDVKPAYSPFRDLGPPDDTVHRLRTKAASILISFWPNSNPKKHKSKPISAPPVSFGGSGELQMDGEALWGKVNEDTRTTARIAEAIGVVDDQGFSNKTMMCSLRTKDLRPIPDSEYCRNGLRLVEKRSRRKWVVRKLRRPARFFRAFFKAIWRIISFRKWRHRKRGNIDLSYESLAR